MNGKALEFASEELRRDEVVVRAAVEQDVSALKYAAERGLALMTADWETLKYAREERKRDKDFVLAAGLGIHACIKMTPAGDPKRGGPGSGEGSL